MDKAHKATNKRIASMEAHLRAIYKRADKEVREAWDKYMQTAEEELKPLQKAYEDAKKSGDKEKIRETGRILAAKKREMTITNAHYKAVVERTAQELTHVNEIATAYVNGELPDVYALNYNFVATGMQEVSGISFDLYDAHTVRNLAMSDETLLPYKVVDVAKDVRWNTKLINSEVLQGILQGESMSDIAARLTRVENMAANAAIRNARTMVTSAENKGRIDMMNDAEKQGVIALKRWISTHDARTRDWHAELDGKMQEKDKPFENSVGKIMYPGDPSADPANIYSCRCAIGYKVTGFKKAQVQKDMAEKQVEERQASAFTPAKTTEGAEAYAKEHIFSGAYLGKTSYKGIDVDMANGINETLERITKKYGRKLSGIEVVNPKTAKGLKALGGSADAPFATNSLNGMVYINKDIVKNAKALKAYTDKGDEAFKLVMANKDKLSGKMRALAEIYEKAGKDLVDNSLEGMITHEYGHYLAVEINPKSDVVSKIADGMGDHLISGYSQHNVREYLAECFTEYERGDRSKLDPVVIELFDGAIKR